MWKEIIIICKKCGKYYSSENYKLIPMIGKIQFKQNQVYLHDCGWLYVLCECGQENRVLNDGSCID